jgi:hypothetical protein
MSESNRSARVAAADRRILAALILAGGAVAVGAMLSSGAEARSAAMPSNVSPPTISGTAVTGETLTASTGSWTGTPPISYAFAWERCDASGAGCGAIAGETAQTYVVAAGDLGFTLRVLVTATNAEGSASAESAQTAVVSAPTVPVNTAEPVVSGSPVEGATLTTTTGTWNGTSITYAYQWVRCDADGGLPDGSNCPSISGATSSGYTLTGDDIGRRLRVQVTASNSAGSATAASNPTATVTQSTTTGPPQNTVEPSITGTPTQGLTLFASIGTWSGATPITYAYQWLRCGADGGQPSGSDCAAITGATTAQYVPTTADVAQRLRVRVTARNATGTATATSNPGAQVQSTAPAQSPSPSPALPPGAIRLPNGKVSIPVTSVSLPERLIVGEFVFTPNPVRSRERALELRVRVVDTRGYVVRDALVFARATPLLTSPPGEQRTGRDGWVRLRMTPRPDFPLQDGRSVQFWIRTRKQGDDVLAGVSNRRLVQVATAR